MAQGTVNIQACQLAKDDRTRTVGVTQAHRLYCTVYLKGQSLNPRYSHFSATTSKSQYAQPDKMVLLDHFANVLYVQVRSNLLRRMWFLRRKPF